MSQGRLSQLPAVGACVVLFSFSRAAWADVLPQPHLQITPDMQSVEYLGDDFTLGQHELGSGHGLSKKPKLASWATKHPRWAKVVSWSKHLLPVVQFTGGVANTVLPFLRFR